ncbi:MAG: flavoprotein [Rhodospirillaceae bacterium]|nr:flavoprotein [Rhodospirillaceae bacterium]
MSDQKTATPDAVIIGAGPIGIAAAAHLLARGLTPLVLEKGPAAGHAIREWGHVNVFTPWKHVTDKAVEALLAPTGWKLPDPEHLPTGQEIVDSYLVPAVTTAALANCIIYNADVRAVSKRGHGKPSSENRDTATYNVHYGDADGAHRIVEAAAVIDASGTWFQPNPIGIDGLPVPGEQAAAASIDYGIPDVLDKDKANYAGKRILVLGGGHSAINVSLDLLSLKKGHGGTKLFWGLRRNNIDKLIGGGINDELPARGALGLAAKEAMEAGSLKLLAPFSVRKIDQTVDGLNVHAQVDGRNETLAVDRIVVAAGFRPDLEMLRELRLDLDEIVEAPRRLAPLIDPNLHSCGTVPPHGVDELSHPDRNFFIVGMKAYGRAPTFLMKTGYEQVRSIADELAGHYDAARRIELDLPETGVCACGPKVSSTRSQFDDDLADRPTAG